MIFSLIILILIAGIAFFHYIQGFFSATISAIITVLASAIALSYFETVTATLLRGKMADQAYAITICCLFAITYLGLRLIMDKLVPGNIRLPVLADKIGAGAMGVVAGMFAAGTVAVAAQTLPFGPTIGGYARYETFDKEDFSVTIPGLSRRVEVSIWDEMKNDSFDEAQPSSLWIPVDELVVGLVSRLSQGSMSGDQPFTRVHPDLLRELYSNRLGIQIGAKRSTMPQQAKLEGVYSIESVGVVDSELGEIRGNRTVPASIKATPTEIFLVVRVTFTNSAAEASDRFVRLSPASVRLVAGGKNYNPIGTMQASVLYSNKVDDFLIVDVRASDASADLVFKLPYEEVAVRTNDTKRPEAVAEGVFIEVKRFARIDLGGQAIATDPPASGEPKIVRKPGIQQKIAAKQADDAATLAGFEFKSVAVNDKFFTSMATNTPLADADKIELPGGLASLRSKKFAKLEILKPVKLGTLMEGQNQIEDFFVPEGKHIVQIWGVPPAKPGTDAWAWAEKIGKFGLIDAEGKRYSPNGAWSRVKIEGVDHVIARYNSEGVIPGFKRDDGRPSENCIAFLVPSGVLVQQVTYEGKNLAAAAVLVP